MVPSGLGAVASLGALWRGQRERLVIGRRARPFSRWTCCTAIRGAAAAERRTTPSGCGCVSAAAAPSARPRPRPAARRTVVERQAALLRHPDLRLSEQRCVRHRLAVVRRGAGVHAAAVVTLGLWVLGWGGLTILGAVDSLPPGVDEVPTGGRRSDSAGAPTPDRGSTTTAREAISASPRSCRTTNRSFAGFFYEGGTFTRWTACARTTSCSARGST